MAFAIAATPTYADEECADKLVLRLVVDKYMLRLNDKKPICVTAPGKFRIKIKQPADASVNVPAGTARVHEKEGSGLQIRGDNSDVANKIKVTVTGTAETADEFDFLIEVDNVGILDPRIKIIDPDTNLLHNNLALDEAFNDLDADLELFIEWRDDQRKSEE